MDFKFEIRFMTSNLEMHEVVLTNLKLIRELFKLGAVADYVSIKEYYKFEDSHMSYIEFSTSRDGFEKVKSYLKSNADGWHGDGLSKIYGYMVCNIGDDDWFNGLRWMCFDTMRLHPSIDDDRH